MSVNEYYRLSKNKLFDLFNTSENGLSTRESKKRLRKYGDNKLPEKNKLSIISIFINQFQDFMIIVLMAATVLSFLMGEFSDAITIFAIIILNGIMGFIQEYRAERSLKALKQLTAPKAKARRNNNIIEVNARELVPGDIIYLTTGDRVPADARILNSENIQVDESLLTGESVPVEKKDEIIYDRDLAPQSQFNILFMGTTITRGQAEAMVTRTGSSTEMGKIADLLKKESSNITPLQKRLKHLGKWLVIFSVVLTMLIVVTGIIKGQSTYQMFMAGVSLAVAAIPEGLPAIVTLALAIGVQKMINKNAIVRRLPAVETFGCATVICSDKTGTLTQNMMELNSIYLNRSIIKSEKQKKNKNLEKLLAIGALCNDARVKGKQKDGTLNKVKNIIKGNKCPQLMGDPTDIGLIKAIYKHGYSLEQFYGKYRILARKSFESERKRMSVLVEDKNNDKKELWVKGAPETIIDLTKYILINGQKKELTPSLKNEILQANSNMAGDALRILAAAYRPVKDNNDLKAPEKYENNLIIAGLVGLMDPPRPEAYQAVEKCKAAGIRPIMITGDQEITARVIARDLGIIDEDDQVITGDQLKNRSEIELRRIVKMVNVFARIGPSEKLKIVKALQDEDQVVAMTGDGVNDAPAVKKADIGVAMGKNGTDVTREVSSLILADDNFATIVAAIKQGREIYKNIRKFIRYLLSCNIGELLTIFLGIAMGLPLPLIPIQILWVNLITDGLPALALGVDQDSDEVMQEKPRDPQESLFARGMVGRITSQGFLIGINTILVFLIGLYTLRVDLTAARTMAFSTLVFSQLFFVFSCKSEKKSLWETPLLSNKFLILAVMISVFMQLIVIYNPFLNRIFQTTILNSKQWLIVLIFSGCSTVILEMVHKTIGEIHQN